MLDRFISEQAGKLATQFDEVGRQLPHSNLPHELVENYIAIAQANIERLRANPSQETLTMAAEAMVLFQGFLERDRVASFDALTGARNRFSFESDLKDALALTKRDEGEVHHHAVLFLDADYFKGINDTLGHLGGDEALRKIVQTALKTARENEHLYRIGGDEFAIILTDVNSNTIEESREHFEAAQRRFVDAFTQLTVEHNGREMPLQVSSGFYILHGNETVNEVKEAADAALYHSKEGRDARQQAVWDLIRARQLGSDHRLING